MEEEKVQEILEKLKQTCPDLEVSMLQTKQRGDRRLIVIQGFSATGDIDDWSINVVNPIMWRMQDKLAEYDGGMLDFRMLFIRGNQFVLWSPDVHFGDVFAEFTKPLHKEVYGYEAQQHYIGGCSDINDVLDYLTHTQVWF